MPSIDASVEVYEKGIGGKTTKFVLEDDLNGEVTLAQFLSHVKNITLLVANEILKEEQSRGFDKNPVIIVDGRVGVDPRNVKPFGQIQFKSKEVTSLEILSEIYQGIMERSKVVTGTYIEGNIVFLNGRVIATTLPELKTYIQSSPAIKPKDEFRFINVIPYARKLERLGVTAQRTQSRSVKSKDKKRGSGKVVKGANGPYYLTTRAATRKYKGNVQIYFGYILGSTLGVQSIPAQTKDGKKLRRTFKPKAGQKITKRNSGPYLYPQIKVIIGEGSK